jgi:hypothetical protein
LAVRDVDRPVEVADSELEDVTKPDEIEALGSGFNVEEDLVEVEEGVEEGVEESVVVKEVDRLVKVADSKLEDVTKLDELELFSGDFNMEESEEEGVEVVVPNCVVIVDEVFSTVVMVFELEDDVRT